MNWESIIRERNSLRPFVPYLVEINTGEVIEVDAADSLIVRGGTGVFVNAGGVPTAFNLSSIRALFEQSSGTPIPVMLDEGQTAILPYFTPTKEDVPRGQVPSLGSSRGLRPAFLPRCPSVWRLTAVGS